MAQLMSKRRICLMEALISLTMQWRIWRSSVGADCEATPSLDCCYPMSLIGCHVVSLHVCKAVAWMQLDGHCLVLNKY
jgi:hypothetical protein